MVDCCVPQAGVTTTWPNAQIPGLPDQLAWQRPRAHDIVRAERLHMSSQRLQMMLWSMKEPNPQIVKTIKNTTVLT